MLRSGPVAQVDVAPGCFYDQFKGCRFTCLGRDDAYLGCNIAVSRICYVLRLDIYCNTLRLDRSRGARDEATN